MLTSKRKPVKPAVKKRRAAKRAKRALLLMADCNARNAVFQRDDYQCVGPPRTGEPRCGKTYGLQWCHVFSRRYVALRHLPENALTMCAGHHLQWHHSPLESGVWFRDSYPERYELLMEARRK